jgi:glycosyltransferase involved in cell wall biosynthesis
MTPADFHDFFERTEAAIAAQASKRLIAEFGGSVIAVHCSCDELWAKMAPAIEHWPKPSDPDAHADFVIFAGTNEGLEEPLQAPDWQGTAFTEAGVPQFDGSEAFDLRFQPWLKVIHAHRDGVGIFWCASAAELPWWEATFPFRILLHWWSRGLEFQLMHAAAVSADGRSTWLIPGPSGSGKSTTVVSLLQAGKVSQGDDYVLVATGETPAVYPLYNSIKLTWEAVDRFFPQLREKLHLPAPQAKAVAPLTTLGTLAGVMPLAGVLVPELPATGGDRPASPFAPINPSAALLAIAPTTLHHLPEGRAESWSKISEMLRRVPVMKWHLVPQIATNVQRFPFAALQQPQRVAVIMPAFNPGPEISRAWESIRRQDWIRASVRLIIIDDASTDAEAVARMQKLAAAFPQHIQLMRMSENAGPAAARNAGIARALSANSDWIAFCDHDDEWPAGKWLRQAGHALENPHLEIIGGLVKYHVAEGVEDPIDRYLDEEKHVSHVHLGAIFVRPSVFEKVGQFDADMRFSEDFDWWNRAREAGIQYAILPHTTLHYHFHGANSVAGKSAQSLGVLDALHRSLQRRRAAASGNAPRPIPSLLDTHRAQAYDLVIPVHNGLKFLPGLVESIANQTLKPASVIFVDDVSTDGSGDWLEQHVLDLLGTSAQIHRLPTNLGVAGARNVGWKAGKSPWVAFLDQDDLWLPEKAERQLASLMSDSKAHWGTVWCRPLLEPGFQWPANWAPSMREPHKCAVPSGWMISRSALHRLGGFNESYRYGDDTEIAGRLRDGFGYEKVLEEILVERQFGAHNNSHKKEAMTRELMQILRSRVANKSRKEFAGRQLTYVIVPVFNGERFLNETLSAIEGQTHQDWIGCVVNDGSTDASLEIAQNHARQDLRWRVIDLPNGGAPAAINAALKAMPDEVTAVAFCDSDDVWLPEKLTKQWSLAPDLGVTAWSVATLAEEFEDFPADVVPAHRARPGAHKAMLRTNAMLSRAAIDQLGPMDEEVRFGDFIGWMSPLINRGVETNYVEEVLVRRRIHGANMTAQPDQKAYLQLLRRHLQDKKGKS